MLFDSDMVAFIGVALIVVITPGPDMVLVTTHALATGRSAARMAAIGVCAGVLVHAAAAVVGLSALLATSSVAFAVLGGTGSWTHDGVLSRLAPAEVCRDQREDNAIDAPATDLLV